ncbi:MAG TPA: hypothetical protein VN714_13740 [Trebonia sp.]|nr:hypothetical protein [Trebonia sp.]
MMPDIDREGRRKKRAPVIASILLVTAVMAALLQSFQPDWAWVSLAIGIVAITAVGVSIDPPRSHKRGSRRRGSDLTGHGRAEDDGPAGMAAHRWRTLARVSRLMPGPAGRRWLAEADSLLSDIEPARRTAAIRSYLLSAPRLAVMMWAHQLHRRARLGPRRPG